MKKSTEELLSILKNTNNISTYMEDQKETLDPVDLTEALEQLLDARSITKSDCIYRSGLDRTYCYQIFSGRKTPSRDKLLALCLAMELSAAEVQSLLKQTGYAPLYPKLARDSVILFAFYHKLSLTDLNELLYEMDLELVQ